MSVTTFMWISRFFMIIGLVVGIVTIVLYVKLDIVKAWRILFDHGISNANRLRKETGQKVCNSNSKDIYRNVPIQSDTEFLPRVDDEPATEVLQDTQILTGRKPITKYEVTYIHTKEVI